MIKEIRQDIFTLPAEALVCPVNCQGVMGAGLARQFKERYLAVYQAYRQASIKREIRLGNDDHRPIVQETTPKR